jgi:iron complex outermembrane receptor protein
VRNVTDKRAKTSSDSLWGGFMKATFVEPRMFGIRAGFNY